MSRSARHIEKKKQMSVGAMVALDLLCIVIGLNVFALFHHVLHFNKPVEPVVLATIAPQPTPAPTPETGAEPSVEPSEEPHRVYNGMWGEKFADKFTDGEVIVTDDSYQSANVNVTFTRVEGDGVIYHVAEIYISDLKYLRSGFANDAYNGGIEPIAAMAERSGAIVALSGDHYYGRYEGIVVRNGELWRETRFADICVLLSDGSMVTMEDAQLDLDELKAAQPYQVWSFGPELLDAEGKAKTSFNSNVTVNNPRSAIGYVEPGHYFFVEVDGRIYNSRGMTMSELARLFESLGCTRAYNLDGGQSSGIVWLGELASYNYGRNVSDIIYIVDEPQEG